jgi:hypothetical protein
MYEVWFNDSQNPNFSIWIATVIAPKAASWKNIKKLIMAATGLNVIAIASYFKTVTFAVLPTNDPRYES